MSEETYIEGQRAFARFGRLKARSCIYMARAEAFDADALIASPTWGWPSALEERARMIESARARAGSYRESAAAFLRMAREADAEAERCERRARELISTGAAT